MGIIPDYIVGPIVVFVLGNLIWWLLKGVLPDKLGLRGWLKRHIWPHWQWVVTSAILLMATLAFLQLWLASPTPVDVEITLPPPVEVETTEPTVKITKLELPYGSPVITVEGIYRSIPQQLSLWIVSFSYTSHQFYVQQRPAPMPKVQSEPWIEWRALAAISADQDGNMECRFEVWAVIVGRDTERYFYDHLGEGMDYLPEEARNAYDQIEIRLKSK